MEQKKPEAREASSFRQDHPMTSVKEISNDLSQQNSLSAKKMSKDPLLKKPHEDMLSEKFLEDLQFKKIPENLASKKLPKDLPFKKPHEDLPSKKLPKGLPSEKSPKNDPSARAPDQSKKSQMNEYAYADHFEIYEEEASLYEYLDDFFSLFINENQTLCEDVVAVALQNKQVQAVGYGLNSNSLPCFKLLVSSESFESDKKMCDDLITEAATHISKLRKFDPIKCKQFIEVGKMIELPKSSDLCFAGETFSFHSDVYEDQSKTAVSKGTVTCLIKVVVEVSTDMEVTCIEDHFAMTCAHCILPTNPNGWKFKKICKSKMDATLAVLPLPIKQYSSQSTIVDQPHSLIYSKEYKEIDKKINNEEVNGANEDHDHSNTLTSNFLIEDTFDPTCLFHANYPWLLYKTIEFNVYYSPPPEKNITHVGTQTEMKYLCSRFGVFTHQVKLPRMCLNNNWKNPKNPFTCKPVCHVSYTLDIGILRIVGDVKCLGAKFDDEMKHLEYPLQKTSKSAVISNIDSHNHYDGEKLFTILRPKQNLHRAIASQEFSGKLVTLKCDKKDYFDDGYYQNPDLNYLEVMSSLDPMGFKSLNEKHRENCNIAYKKYFELPEELGITSENFTQAVYTKQNLNAVIFKLNNIALLLNWETLLSSEKRSPAMEKAEDFETNLQMCKQVTKRVTATLQSIGAEITDPHRKILQFLSNYEKVAIKRKYELNPTISQIKNGAPNQDIHASKPTATPLQWTPMSLQPTVATETNGDLEVIEMDTMMDMWRGAKKGSLQFELKLVKNKCIKTKTLKPKEFYFELNRHFEEVGICKFPVIIFDKDESNPFPFIEEGDSGSPLFLVRKDSKVGYFQGIVCGQYSATRWDVGIHSVAPQILQYLLKNKALQQATKNHGIIENLWDKLEYKVLSENNNGEDSFSRQVDFPWSFTKAIRDESCIKHNVTVTMKIRPCFQGCDTNNTPHV